MHKKHLKFVSITEAFAELQNTLDMQTELKKREEIEPLLRRIEDLQIRKGTRKVHPLELVRRNGLWIKSHGSEKFYYGIDLVKFFFGSAKFKTCGNSFRGVFRDPVRES